MFNTKLFIILSICVFFGFTFTTATINNIPGSGILNLLAGKSQRGCPLCDSSVYSYCHHRKLAEDASCCNGVYGPHCLQYLHANSCHEHKLIVDCCCNNPYPYRH